MSNLLYRLKCWLRGYQDKDIESCGQKLSGPLKPGSIIPVTRGEMKALTRRVE